MEQTPPPVPPSHTSSSVLVRLCRGETEGPKKRFYDSRDGQPFIKRGRETEERIILFFFSVDHSLSEDRVVFPIVIFTGAF